MLCIARLCKHGTSSDLKPMKTAHRDNLPDITAPSPQRILVGTYSIPMLTLLYQYIYICSVKT